MAASGRTRADFARSVGTSASRLSTYVNGSVTPSAAMLVRMRRVAAGEPCR
ncbi:MAG: helix-turn-helix domain-containing protein [Pseudonocardia sp.]|nr:helix-turn-helix domain-containing protein [Pseudonocardia sp.]